MPSREPSPTPAPPLESSPASDSAPAAAAAAAAPLGGGGGAIAPERGAGSEFARVLDLLARARARQRRVLIGEAACWTIAALLALMIPVLALAARSGSSARLLAAGVVLGCAAGFAVAGPLRARRQAGDLAATARLLSARLQDSAPVLRRGLVPALELGRELESGKAEPFSPALARAHVETVALAASTADLARALPDRALRRARLGLLATGALAVLVVGLGWSAVFGRGAHQLFAAALGAARGAVSRAAEPVTGEVELTYVYPAYTHLPPKSVPNTNGEIAALKGTEVRIKTRSDRPVAKAFAVVGEAELPLEVKDGRELSGTLLVSKPGSYRFRYLDGRGRVLVEGPAIPIAVEADAAPKVEILSPSTELEVEPRSRVPVRFEADDDYGLSEVALLYKLPGASKAQRVLLQRSSETPRRSSGEYGWDLTALGLMAGDRIAYYLEAVDNDDVSGHKSGVSRTQYLKVYSEAEHHRQTVQRIQENWEKLVTLLGDRLESPDRTAEGRASAERVRAQAEVDARALALARDFEELARDLRKQKSPDQLWRALFNASSGLGERARATSSARELLASWLQRGIAAGDAAPHRHFESSLNSEIAEEERSVLYLETLLDQQRIQDLIALSKELAAKRRDLADLLEKYRTAPDEATRERLQTELARLKERMAELMQRMAELSRGISDEHVNAEALKEMGETGKMMDSFDRIQDMLNRGQVEDAMKEMEKLGQMLDGLQENLQKASGDFRGGEFAEVGKKLQDFARELEDLQREQEKVLDDTQQIRAKAKKQLDEKLAKNGDELVRKLRAKTEEVQKRLAAIEDPTDPFREQELRAAKEDLADLDKALQVHDFDQAAQSTAKSLAHAQRLADELGRMAEDLKRYPQAFPNQQAETLQRNAKNAQGAVPTLQEIQKELANLFPPPSQAMSEADRQRMRELAERQNALQQQASGLQQRMGEINQQAPIFDPQASEMMRGAGERMGKAQGQLQGRNPTGAMAEQRAALDQLGQLQKGLQQQQQQGQGSGGGAPIPWPWMGPGGPSSGQTGQGNEMATEQKVEIPGAEQYQVPEEYRKDILDAMKQPSPDRYREQVKRYYEEIVK